MISGELTEANESQRAADQDRREVVCPITMRTYICNHFRFASASLDRLSLNYERFL